MLRRGSALVILAALLHGAPAAAWNVTGHMTVAWIAVQEFRDSGLEQRVIAILEQHPAYRDTTYRLNWQRNLPQGLTQSQFCAFLLMQAAEWPDSLRDRTAKLLDPETGRAIALEEDMHYVNLPVGDSRHFPERIDGHIVQKLQRCQAALRDSRTSANQQSQALAWLAHLVGDIHQPLHCVEYYSPFLPRGDTGGNSLITSPTPVRLQPPFNANSRLPSLHHYWDDVLGKTNKSEEIAAIGQALMKQYPRAQLSAELQTPGFESWTDEGRTIANNWVYLFEGYAIPCVAKSEVENHLKRNESVDVPVLPAGYLTLSRQIAEHRVALAGYRLADELRAVLRPQ